MPVVINELEVLTDQAPAQRVSEADRDESSATATKIEPLQVAKALAWLAERAMRVWAH